MNRLGLPQHCSILNSRRLVFSCFDAFSSFNYFVIYVKMASSTVLRVKRRLEDNPQDALVLMCKRKKTDTEEISPSLFVFRATVENQETSHIKSIVPKTDIKLQSTPNVHDIIEKLRKERKEQSSISRYEVINCSRGLDTTEVDHIDLVDLQKANDEQNDVQYAYDLYISAKQDFDVSMLDNLVSIEHYETDLILGANNNGDSSDEANDDDDSNDENNWRNEYPDSEKSSIDEEDMIRAMERVDLEDLSSDDAEDNIYEPGLTDDVTRYGPAYAKYKARVMADNPDLNEHSKGLVHVSTGKDMDEESVDGYKDDSDDGFYYGQDEDREQLRDHQTSDDSDAYAPD